MTTETTGSGIRPQIPLQIITPDMVRASVKRARKSLEAAAAEIVWQIEREAWVTLGYSSWTAMREAEYGGAAFMVPAKSRPEIVARIQQAGLTQREIARTAGVDEGTVRNDIKKVSAEYSALEDNIIDAEIVEEHDDAETTKPTQPTTGKNTSRELTIVNDIRLYVGKIGTAPEIRGLSPKAKQHIIDALTDAITELRKE